MTVSDRERVVLVGNPTATHVGGHLAAAAAMLPVDLEVCDSRKAYVGLAWRRHLAWRAGGRRPVGLRRFSRHVVEAVRATRATTLVTTGIAPVDRSALEEIGTMGVARVNFLTDDPWNPAHRAPWFFQSLGAYDRVHTPRRRNVRDLEALGGPAVSYLAFAYNQDQHYPEPPAEPDAGYDADVMFAGGADADRLEVLRSVMASGIDVALYGAYWERYRDTRPRARGILDAAGLRAAVAGARICLCLVRRANRDGHAMRTFEVAAMGGCMLLERTDEHEALFGADDECVRYFESTEDIAGHARDLLADDALRHRLAMASHQRVTRGGHTYVDRLREMLAPGQAA